MSHMHYFLLLLLILSSCSSSNEENTTPGEYIFRTHDDVRLPTSSYTVRMKPHYPWQPESEHSLHPITKEYFRCKGFQLNPPKIVRENDKEIARYTDCGGADKHSLPIRNGKEYVFPILLELVNHVQEITKKPVVITTGHRCPDHNSYVDPSPQNQGSKHLIGAACSFYVKGLENNPEAVVKIVQDYYKLQTCYAQQKEYQEFKRFEKATNCSTQPWYNKEIFIKLYKAHEGRDGDNPHTNPYLNIQVRFDRERNVPLTFTWTDAQQFLRK